MAVVLAAVELLRQPRRARQAAIAAIMLGDDLLLVKSLGKGRLCANVGELGFAPTKAMKDAQAKVLEVGHPKGSPQNRAQPMVETLGTAITASAPEIVGNLVHPIVQRRAKPLQAR